MITTHGKLRTVVLAGDLTTHVIEVLTPTLKQHGISIEASNLMAIADYTVQMLGASMHSGDNGDADLTNLIRMHTLSLFAAAERGLSDFSVVTPTLPVVDVFPCSVTLEPHLYYGSQSVELTVGGCGWTHACDGVADMQFTEPAAVQHKWNWRKAHSPLMVNTTTTLAFRSVEASDGEPLHTTHTWMHQFYRVHQRSSMDKLKALFNGLRLVGGHTDVPCETCWRNSTDAEWSCQFGISDSIQYETSASKQNRDKHWKNKIK